MWYWNQDLCLSPLSQFSEVEASLQVGLAKDVGTLLPTALSWWAFFLGEAELSLSLPPVACY